MNTLFRLAVAVTAAVASVQALRIGYADYLFGQDTVESLRRATLLWPRNAQYDSRLADLNPAQAILHLRRAVALNPGLSNSWIQLGLRTELEGRSDEAEQYYLEATRRDRQFLPAWTLAGFYARRRDAAQYWPWARDAAQMSYSDIRPLLRLAFDLAPSPEIVLEKMIVSRRKVEHEFLAYLMAERLDASAIVARMADRGEREDVPALLEWMDRLLETGRTPEARRLWDTLSARRLIPYSPKELLTNAEFSGEPLQAGFDWRIATPPGVTHVRSGGGLRVQFSGQQPESCELAVQYLALMSGRSYELAFEYRTVDMIQSTGLRWRWGGAGSPALAPTDRWTQWRWRFASDGANRLALFEQRDPGATRPEGIFYLRGLNLTVLANP